MQPGAYCNTNNKTSPIRIQRQINKRRAMELRMSKTSDGRIWTYDMIGDELGVAATTVWKWISEAITEIKHDNRERAQELRAINHQRLELAIDKIVDKIQNDGATAKDYNVLIRLIQTQNKMWGINEPEALELTVKIEDMTTEEKIKRIGELMEMAHMARLPGAPTWRVVDPADVKDDKIADSVTDVTPEEVIMEDAVAATG